MTRPAAIQLRGAEMADAADLLAWRNDRDARRASFHTAEIRDDEHRRWLASRLADSNCRLWIATSGEQSVGQVRVERRAPDSAEISIAVAPKHRGKGYAPEILQAALREVTLEGFATEVVARVKPCNAASLAAFERAGFQRTERDNEALVLVARSSPS